jgi:branched-chain amino acid aminotransferase
MQINYNGTLWPESPALLLEVQRALYYGDALFESMRVSAGKIPLLVWHWERLESGMKALGYVVPDHWSVSFFQKEVMRAVSSPNARVRFTVWRSPGGLYYPENNDPMFLVTASPLDNGRFTWLEQGLSIGLCPDYRLPVDVLSGYKTLNAARYVAAARYAHAMGWDDALLLNHFDRICETSNSNVCWFEGDQLCTVPISDGCVTGTFRKLLWVLKNEDADPICEKSVIPGQLKQADELFLTNAVQGIRWVREFEGKVYPCLKTKALFQKVVEQLDSKNGI